MNRVQIPVEVRWRYKFESREMLKVRVQFVEGFDVDGEELSARHLHDGRITIPWEVVWKLNIDKPGCMLRVLLEPSEIPLQYSSSHIISWLKRCSVSYSKHCICSFFNVGNFC